MKYFKATKGDYKNSLRIIAGEVINITYGITYYKDGIILDKPIPRHNTYEIDGVEYDITQIIGSILIIDDTNPDLLGISYKLHKEFLSLYDEVLKKHNLTTLRLPSGKDGTTQYILFNDVVSKQQQGKIGFKTVKSGTLYDESLTSIYDDFTWWIHSNIKNMPVTFNYCKHSNYIRNEHLIISANLIILDFNNFYNLKHGYRCINLPSLENLTLYSENRILTKPILYSKYSGISIEIMKYSFNKKLKRNFFIDSVYYKNIKFAKWEWIQPYLYNRIEDTDIDPFKQILNGILDHQAYESESTSYKDSRDVHGGNSDSRGDVHGGNSDSRYKCFLTGLPIYEDCYVFDIYQQYITEQIPVHKLADYPNAVIITDKDLESTASKSNVSRPRASTRNVAGDARNTAKKSQKNQIITNANVEFITIKYLKTYNTPKYILISPIFIHNICGIIASTVSKYQDEVISARPIGINNWNECRYQALAVFEIITKTKALLYRTFCPVTLKTTIDELDAPNINKDILHSLNKNVVSYKNCIQADNYKLYDTDRIYDLMTEICDVAKNKNYVYGIASTY